jgi:hypothetical protein
MMDPELRRQERLILRVLQRIAEPTRQIMILDDIQYLPYWWSATLDFIPPRIFPSVIGRHGEAYDDAQDGKADIERDTLNVSRCFIIGEAEGSQD